MPIVRDPYLSWTPKSRVFVEYYTTLSLENMSKAASSIGCELRLSLVPRKLAIMLVNFGVTI